MKAKFIKMTFLIVFILLSEKAFSDNKQRTVLLCGDKGWDSFEAYINYLNEKKVSYKLSDIIVKVWDGKDFKEYSIKWVDYLSGEPPKSIWKKKLSRVKTFCDESVISKAVHYKWDVYPENLEVSNLVDNNKSNSQNYGSQLQLKSIDQKQAEQDLRKGLEYVYLKKYQEAVDKFSSAIQKNPKYVTAYVNRAVAYRFLGKHYNAIEDLKKAEEIDPKNPYVHYNLAAFYASQKEFNKSIEHLDKALTFGFSDHNILINDPDFNNMKNLSEFRKVLEKHKIFILK